MKCKYEYDLDCCNSRAKQYMCKCKQPCDDITLISNLEHIQHMSVTELARQLIHFNPYPVCSDGIMFEEYSDALAHELKWLNQPYVRKQWKR